MSSHNNNNNNNTTTRNPSASFAAGTGNNDDYDDGDHNNNNNDVDSSAYDATAAVTAAAADDDDDDDDDGGFLNGLDPSRTYDGYATRAASPGSDSEEEEEEDDDEEELIDWRDDKPIRFMLGKVRERRLKMSKLILKMRNKIEMEMDKIEEMMKDGSKEKYELVIAAQTANEDLRGKANKFVKLQKKFDKWMEESETVTTLLKQNLEMKRQLLDSDEEFSSLQSKLLEFYEQQQHQQHVDDDDEKNKKKASTSSSNKDEDGQQQQQQNQQEEGPEQLKRKAEEISQP